MSQLPRIIGLIGLARSGKTTVSEYLSKSHNFKCVAFAEPVKAMLKSAFPDTDFESGDRTQDIPSIGVSPRKLMQALGTDWGRNLICDYLWVSLAFQKAESLYQQGHNSIVFTDVRYRNEAEAVLNSGGVLWHIQRDNLPTMTHSSEGEVWDGTERVEIQNNGSISDLIHKVEVLLRGKEYIDFLKAVRDFSQEEFPTLCTCKHKLQDSGAVFYQSVQLLNCSNCKGWQRIRKPIQ